MKSADYKNNGEITNIQIGDALKKIRREKGLTQKQAASEMGVSQTYISAVEQGKRTARTDFVIKLIKFYGVSYESVFGKNENDEKKKSGMKNLSVFFLRVQVWRILLMFTLICADIF